MSQNLSVNNFKWVVDISEFDESFIKSYNEKTDKGSFFEVNFQYPEKLHNLHNDLPFSPERIKTEKSKSLFLILKI